MEIRELSRDECLGMLSRTRLARLACAHENQPYVVPVYLAYSEPPGSEPCLYGFTTPGQKIEWMRANPLVCVEVDEITDYDQWASVIVLGRYEELSHAEECEHLRRPAQELSLPGGKVLTETGRCDDELHKAWQVLETLPLWWQPGSAAWAARAHRNPAEPFIPVYYKIRIDQVTGHEAIPDVRRASSDITAAVPAEESGWLRRTLTRVFGGREKEASSASRAETPTAQS